MDYASNSHKNAEKSEEPKGKKKELTKVISSDVVKKPKPLGRRFKDVFFGGEFSGAARYIAADVLLPALRNLVVDSVEMGIKRMVYGDTMSRRRSTNEYSPRVRYDNPIRRNPDPRDRTYLPDQPPHPYTRNRTEANDIIIASRDEAQLVLESLIEVVDMYGVASLADLYELVGLPSAHTDNKWGWTSLANSGVRQLRDGYLIELPTMEPL